MSKRILFGMFPAWGHAAPTVAIAQELRERGHEVAYATHPHLFPLLEAAGLDSLPEFAWGELTVRSQEHMRRHGTDLRWWLFVVRGRPGFGFVHDLPGGIARLRKAIGAFRPDVIVNDLAFAPGPIAAELEGIPWAGSCPFILPHWEEGLPPYGSGLRYGAPKNLRWRIYDRRGRLFRRRMDRVINRARRAVGLASAPHPFSALSPWLDLVYVTEATEYPRPSLGREVHYVGPSISPRRGDHRSPFPWDRLDDRPLVLATLGTIFTHHESFFTRCAEAARGQPWQLVMRVSPGFDRELGGLRPENVLLVTEVPQLELLKRCAAMVTHAGINSVLEALSEAVPLVLAPAAVDQPDMAERVVRTGAGLRIDLRRAGAGEIRAAIGRVLSEPSFRESAERVAADFARCDAPRAGADLIERLAETGEPVLRPAGSGPTTYAPRSSAGPTATAARSSIRSPRRGPSNDRPIG